MIIVLDRLERSKIKEAYQDEQPLQLTLSGIGPVDVKMMTRVVDFGKPDWITERCLVLFKDPTESRSVIGTLCVESVTPEAYRVVIRNPEFV